MAACVHWPLNSFADQRGGFKINEEFKGGWTGTHKLSKKKYIERQAVWCFCFFSFNLYLINQLPTPCSALGLVNKQC